MSDEKSFSYKYSSSNGYSTSEQAEIEKIVNKYKFLDDRSSKVNQIRKIDKKVTSFATYVSIILGLAGLLVFGFGMSCVLVWKENLFVLGIISGILGISVMGFNPAINSIILEKRRAKFASQIIELSRDILKM